LLAVAADGRELAGFAAREPADAPVRWGCWCNWGGGKALVVADGIGREAAKRAVASALELYDVSALISIGYVGSLRPGWAVGEVFLAEQVTRPGAALEYPVSLPQFCGQPCPVRRGVLATVDYVAATVEEKRRLRTLGADAVDMEAFEVAAEAEKRGLPFFCVRVVSDDAETDLEFDFDRARRADGSVSGAVVVAQAGLSPARWRKLFELKRNGEIAARNLAKFLETCRFPLESTP
jgi:adenosylhomocysteine/aminodeoxyfutalosine nucleosidase